MRREENKEGVRSDGGRLLKEDLYSKACCAYDGVVRDGVCTEMGWQYENM